MAKKMPTITLRKDELTEWTHGKSDIVSQILTKGIQFLQETTTERDGTGLSAKYKVPISITRSIDVTELYSKLIINVISTFNPQGDNRLALHSPGKSVDATALLGAYFRASIVGADGQNIVELNEQELQAVYDFVTPLVPKNPQGITAKIWLDSFKGTPNAKHKQVLLKLILKGISEDEWISMSKEKYREDIDTFLDSMLNIVDFMRTPFRVVDNEEVAMKAQAKKAGGAESKSSGVDLQWTAMIKAFERSMDNLIQQKKKSPQKRDAKKIQSVLRENIMWAQSSFGIENERYKLIQEFAKITTQTQVQFKQIQATLGVAGDDPDTLVPALNDYVAQFRENIIKSNAEKAEAIRAMSLTDMVDIYTCEWQTKYDEVITQLLAAQKKASETMEQLTTNQLNEQQQASILERQLQDKSTELKDMHKKMKPLAEQLQNMVQKVHESEQMSYQIQDLLLKNKTLEEQQLSLTKQTQQDGSTIHILEEQLEHVKLENQHLLNPFKLAADHKEPALVDSHSQELERRKNKLFLVLGTIANSLNEQDRTHIEEQITNSISKEDLQLAEHEIQSLSKINKFIIEINKGILQRGSFFSSDPHKKIAAIERAFQALTIKEKIQLTLLTNKQIKTEIDKTENELKNNKVGQFLHEIHHNRGWLFSLKEATSFTLFKSGIKTLRKEVPEDVLNELALSHLKKQL